MKAKDAHAYLSHYQGDNLYQEACKLFRGEAEARIKLRSHGKPPSRGVIESVLDEMRPWFLQVAHGLWSNLEMPDRIIEWGTGETWVRYNMVDPRIEEYGKRARLEMLRGTQFPLLEALGPDTLDALGSQMMAKIVRDSSVWLEVEDGRKKLADKMGLKVCSYHVDARFCPHQESYSMAGELLPTSTSQIAFLCTLRDGSCPRCS